MVPAAPEESFFEEIKRYVGFDAEDERLLRELAPRIVPHAQAISDTFYERILGHPGARRSITGGDAQVTSLRRTLAGWVRELFEGPWDHGYYERRARIGRRHVEISLPQQYMLTAMNVMRVRIAGIVLDSAVDLQRARVELRAVDRLLDLDLAVMLHTYREDSFARVQRSERLATFGQLTASIAHELRNPLGVIESSSFLLRRRVGDATEGVTRHLDRIDAQVQLSNKIITSLLDLVRDRPWSPSEVTLGQLVASAMEAAPPCAASVTVSLGDAARARLRVDAVQMRQALVNLLGNACDAAGSEGEVRVTASLDHGEVLLVVNDTGPGVAPEVRQRLFEPLMTTKVRGIGLGLALCRRLVEQNNGRIELTTGALPGAAFALRLPTLVTAEGDA